MGSIGITDLARAIIRNYDFNYNGVIDLKHPTKGDETTRLEVQQSTYQLDYFVWDHKKLFAKADADGDGQVTQAELETVLKTFDKDGDGKLSAKTWIWNPPGEYEDYEKELGEDLDSHWVVPITPPPNPPIPPHAR